jgi:hypothetical protein
MNVFILLSYVFYDVEEYVEAFRAMIDAVKSVTPINKNIISYGSYLERIMELDLIYLKEYNSTHKADIAYHPTEYRIYLSDLLNVRERNLIFTTTGMNDVYHNNIRPIKVFKLA